MNTQLTVIASIRAKAGNSKSLGERLLQMVEATRREPGCLEYNIHVSKADPDLWCFYENWSSEADLNVHFETPAFKAMVTDVKVLQEGEWDIQYFQIKS